jgi:hypothetical protein
MTCRPLTWLAISTLAWIGSPGCSSDAESEASTEDTTTGPGTTTSPEPGSESSTTTTSPATTDETAGDDGPGSIACGPMLCTEGLLCVREITDDERGQPHSEWFCRSKPEACGDGPGNCECAISVCYNDPCSCMDTGANRFTCTNDGTCAPGGTTEDTGTDTGTSEDSTGSSSTSD